MPAAKPPEFRRRAVELACLDEHRARAELVKVSAGRIGGGGRVGVRGGRRGVTSGAEWERGAGVLRAHVAAGGTATPGTRLVVNGFALGRWVARRRELFRAGTLPAERVAVLEAVPGWSWGRTQQDRFEEGLTHLRTYVDSHGTADVPRGEVIDGFRLGQWVVRRRQSQVAGELRSEWAAVLEVVPGWRWQHPQAVPWAHGAGVLGDWVAEHGSAAVPPEATYQGFPLGAWVQSVRRMNHRGTLQAERVAELEDLPGWAWGSRAARFGEGLALLRAHQEATGSASPHQFCVHPSGFTLGAWVGRVRSLHRAGALPAERVEQMQAVPGWQWTPMAERWQATVQAVRASAAEHGGITNIPRHTQIDGTQVSTWATYQRHRHHLGRLTPQETTALESIPGWWWTPSRAADDGPV